MFFDIFNIPVKGDETIWIPTLGTFWGALIGGVISGALTLIGVQITIKSSIGQQKEEKKKEIARERLTNLYQPASALLSQYFFRHGAHNFNDLTLEEQNDIIFLLDRNIIYADEILDELFLEFKWAVKSKDKKFYNEFYIKINHSITDELLNLREQLGLPKLKDYTE